MEVEQEPKSGQDSAKVYMWSTLHTTFFSYHSINVGILQSLASVQGLLMTIVNLQVQCPVLLLIWLQLELVCNDPRNTVLMMPPPISHYSLEGDGPRER